MITRQQLQAWFDENFEEHTHYLVEIETPQGEEKHFLVATEFSHNIGNDLYEFTRGGGRLIGSEAVSVIDEANLIEQAGLESLIISEDLFDGKMEGPVVLNFPDPGSTPVESIDQRFAHRAYEEGRTSGIEQFGSDNAPSELTRNDIKSILSTYYKELKGHGYYNGQNQSRDHSFVPVSNIAAFAAQDHFNDAHHLDEAHADELHRFSSEMKEFARDVEDKLGKLGLRLNLEDVIQERFEDGAMDGDNSSPLNWLDKEVLINIHPTTHHSQGPDDAMITCNSVSGDAYRVEPDDNFRDTLNFLNISGSEYEQTIKELSGGDFLLSRDNEDWVKIVEEYDTLDQWCPKGNPDGPALVDPKDLVSLIENTNGYGTLTWAINVSLKDILSIPPEELVTLSGGQIGFHDYLNGSGSMENVVRGEKELILSEIDWTPDAMTRYGIDAVYGMVGHAFDGDLQWDKKCRDAYMTECYNIFMATRSKEYQIAEQRPPLPVDNEGHSIVYSVKDQRFGLRIIDIANQSRALFGRTPKVELEPLMNAQDRKTLGIHPGLSSSIEPDQ